MAMSRAPIQGWAGDSGAVCDAAVTGARFIASRLALGFFFATAGFGPGEFFAGTPPGTLIGASVGGTRTAPSVPKPLLGAACGAGITG